MGTKKYEAIVIGASTGGPRAIEEVLMDMPEDIGVPILVVQHMPKGFTETFAKRLNDKCKITVKEARDGEKIEKNIVYIAKGGKHMIIKKDKRILLNNDDTIWGVRPAVDKLMISGAESYKEKLISVILTGMGKDGAEGIYKTKMMNGTTIAQDEKTSVIYGMPKVAYETGKVDFVLPLKEISKKILLLLQ